MQVRIGWSGETRPNQWDKTDVTVDEGDLARILIAAGLDPATPMDTATAYQLLDAEAETLLLAKLATRYGHDSSTAAGKITELSGRKIALLTKLRQTVTDER